MKVVEYLENNSYDDLKNEFDIEVKEYDDRVVLNYGIKSPKFNSIVRECRALILSKPYHNVLCRSFSRFFNYGEDVNSKDFPINEATVYEKIDGSLINVYHDGERWQCATRKMAFAEGLTSSTKRTFREVFIDALGNDPNEAFKYIHKDLVIICELVSPEARVVKPYEKPTVYILEVKNKDTGLEVGFESTFYWDIPNGTKWSYPKKYKFKDLNACLVSAKELPALDEGYVCNYDGWRLKIKNPAYLAIANLRLNGEINSDRIAKLVFMQNHEEYLQYFPEDQKEFDPYIDAYKRMNEDAEESWNKYRDIEDQKEFAIRIKDLKCKGILFGRRSNKDILKTMTEKAKVRLLSSYVGG